ncbi:MAG: hypothetical protein JXQ96_02525 [Cyclobacteriaceae bacterium]
MVGNEVLNECLASEEIDKVTILTRKEAKVTHAKLQEVLIKDFLDLSSYQVHFENIDIAFFCIGVYTGQVPDDLFRSITIDYPVAFANALKQHSPQASLCFLSGAGADRTEKSNMAFAKYKGIAENKLSEIGLGSFHSFRPGYIFPVEKRKEPNLFYAAARFMYPIISLFGSNSSIKSSTLAQAMVKVGLTGQGPEALENKDIVAVVETGT